MFVSSTPEELSTEESTATAGGSVRQNLKCNRLKLPSQYHTSLPVVHVRTRPTLEHLGETKEQRRVWTLDHQNIVVCSRSRALERRPDGSPFCSENASINTLPSPSASSTSWGNSASPTALRRGGQPQYQSPREKLVPPPRFWPGRNVTHEKGKDVMRSRGTPNIVQRGQRFTTPTTSSSVSLNRFPGSWQEEHFTFDFVHGWEATQAEVFEESVLDFVDMALLAQSIAIVCYGPTGSGKTHSMMGPAQNKKLNFRKNVGVRSSTVSHERLQSHSVPGGNAKNEISGEASSSSFRGNTTTAPLYGDTAGSGQPSQQNSGTARSSGPLSDLAGSLRSLDPSLRFPDFSSAMDLGGGGHGHDVGSGDRSALEGRERSMTGSEDRSTDSTETMGLLPRLVCVLLEKCGETITLDAGGVLHGTKSGRRDSDGEKYQENRHHVSSLTLEELTFYGVELYMDEYRDLLDPLKRPISNVGDIGGLEAFCEKMNNPPVSTSRANTRPGKAGENRSSLPLRGGGIPLSSVEDLHRCYHMATHNRVTKAHNLNDSSSRSHAVFIIQLRFSSTTSRDTAGGSEKKNRDSSESASSTKNTYSYVAMVDLAGSERVKETKVEGFALREAQYINKSLSALSAVLLALYHRSSHIPYRDSKLTRLLRPCLERGHVLTLVHVTPCSAEEALNCLKFAEQVRHTEVKTHSFLNATDKLVAVFENLNDSDQEERFIAYHQLGLEYAKLCAEVRLAYLSRKGIEGSQLNLPPLDMSTTALPLVSPLPDDAQRRIREHVIEVLAERHLIYQLNEDAEFQREVACIWRDMEDYVMKARRKKEEEIEKMKVAITQMHTLNAQLAEENSQPVLRDAHAMAINQLLKDISDKVTNSAKERLLLSEGIRLIRQRLAIQDDLERCLDEQLQGLQKNVAQTGTIGVCAPVDGNADEEMGEIYHQQLILSREMSLLRKESACFVRGDEIWEGLWARIVQQELFLAYIIQMEMMEGILFHPKYLRWVIETSGVSSEEVEDMILPLLASTEAVDAGRLSTALAATDTHSSVKPDACNRVAGDKVASTINPISIALLNGDVVKSASTLIGCYNDEEKLQEACVQKLLHEGIFCEIICLPEDIGFDKLMRWRSSAKDGMRNPNLMGHWGCLRLVQSPKDTSSYSLDFYQRTFAGGDKVRERRVMSIPLGEPQLLIVLHVIEVNGILDTTMVLREDSAATPVVLPAIALELHGVRPLSATPQQREKDYQAAGSRGIACLGTPRLADSHPACNGGGEHISSVRGGIPTASAAPPPLVANTTSTTAPNSILLARRLECGGELLLPALCMAACETGSGGLLFHFPERIVSTPTRTEAVECIVGALSALTVPIFELSSTSPNDQTSMRNKGTMSAEFDDVHISTYQHVPYVLLRSNGCIIRGSSFNTATAETTTTTSCLSPRVSGPTFQPGLMEMSLLGYASRLQVRFYFPKVGCVGVQEENGDATACCTPPEPITGMLNSAIAMLNRLGAVVPSSGAKGRKKSDTEALLSRMQQLHAFQKNIRAVVRQQILDAEDIKAELLYSYSECELMRGSHIKKIWKEAQELIDLRQLRSSTPFLFRGTVRATPSLCREWCGARIPWTLWHWVHQWRSLQDVYSQQRRRCHQQEGSFGLYTVDDGDSEDGSDGGATVMEASLSAKDNGDLTTIVFEDVPWLLFGMT